MHIRHAVLGDKHKTVLSDVVFSSLGKHDMFVRDKCVCVCVGVWVHVYSLLLPSCGLYRGTKRTLVNWGRPVDKENFEPMTQARGRPLKP